MKFEKLLFDLVTRCMPDVTTRAFSGMCGMSDGYYGSVVAQGLHMSTDALLHLAEVLHYKREIGGTGVNAHNIDLALKMVSEEVARRSSSLKMENATVRRIVYQALAKLIVERDERSIIPPVILGWT